MSLNSSPLLDPATSVKQKFASRHCPISSLCWLVSRSSLRERHLYAHVRTFSWLCHYCRRCRRGIIKLEKYILHYCGSIRWLNSIISIACCRAAWSTASSQSNSVPNTSVLSPSCLSIRALTFRPEPIQIISISFASNTGLGKFNLMRKNWRSFFNLMVIPVPGMVKQQHTPCTTKKVTARTSELVRRRSSERHTRKMQGASTDARWRDGCKVRTPMQTAMDRNGNGWIYTIILCCVLFLLCCFCCKESCFCFFFTCLLLHKISLKSNIVSHTIDFHAHVL